MKMFNNLPEGKHSVGSCSRLYLGLLRERGWGWATCKGLPTYFGQQIEK